MRGEVARLAAAALDGEGRAVPLLAALGPREQRRALGALLGRLEALPHAAAASLAAEYAPLAADGLCRRRAEVLREACLRRAGGPQGPPRKRARLADDAEGARAGGGVAGAAALEGVGGAADVVDVEEEEDDDDEEEDGVEEEEKKQQQQQQQQPEAKEAPLAQEDAARVEALGEALAAWAGGPHAAGDPREEAAGRGLVEAAAAVMDGVAASALPAALGALGGRVAADEAVLALCRVAAGPEAGYRRCELVFRHVLAPRVRALDGPASRLLFRAVTDAAALNPRAAVRGLLLPVLADPALGVPQCELVARVARDSLPPPLRAELLAGLLEGGAAAWTAFSVRTVEALLGMQTPIDEAAAARLAAAAARASEDPELGAMPQFAKLLFALVTRHADAARPHAAVLRPAAARLKSFMRRAVERKLAAWE